MSEPGRDRSETEESDTHVVSVYAAVGGQGFFDRLVDRFYDNVERDEVLLRLYPDPADLGPARRRLALFLGQYWGGPSTYSEQRGHPRLRMRHLPFEIGATERDRWVAAMLDALGRTMPDTPLDEELRGIVEERMRDYTVRAAEHLVNRPD